MQYLKNIYYTTKQHKDRGVFTGEIQFKCGRKPTYPFNNQNIMVFFTCDIDFHG